MDAVGSPMPSTAPPPMLHLSPTSSQRLGPQQNHTAASKLSHKDVKVRRISPKSKATNGRDAPSAKTNSKGLLHRGASTSTKPLVPLTERRSQQDRTAGHRKKESEADKRDIVPDGGSAGREGRHFAVANVGNNGRIYLRPTVRPAHQRLPQPTFTFPVTPPEPAASDVSDHEKSLLAPGSELFTTLWSPTPAASPLSNGQTYFPDPRALSRPFKHRRAMSDSTIHEAAATAAKESDHGAFKVVISKPGEDLRPRTMEDVDPSAGPILNINIPSWRIGNPRFTLRGSPIFRGSSYAPTEEIRSSGVSFLDRSHGELAGMLSNTASRKPSSLAVPQAFSPLRATHDLPSSPSTPHQHQPRFAYLPTYADIQPAMFDELTFKPSCDERLIVRYAPHTAAVTAATPSRLVAEITSPTFLDYELISDFFLTYRTFLGPQNLLRMLIARLRWAVARGDEIGTVVRVRTFVALRHWILNYFLDDFVIDYDLRIVFCDSVNDFVSELLQHGEPQRVQLRILGELKKCWRRVCAQYWDGIDFDDSLDVAIHVVPGGIAGHRDPNLNPAFWQKDDVPAPQLDSLLPLQKPGPEGNSFFADVSKAGRVPDSVVLYQRPSTPDDAIRGVPSAHAARVDSTDGPTSPTSQASLDVVSCSFPGLTMKMLNPHPSHPLAAHPIRSASVANYGDPVATTPKALTGKRVRPEALHKRNNSLSDSLREHDSDGVQVKDHELVMTSPYAGSLVRGNCLPPGRAFVEMEPSRKAHGKQRQTTVFDQNERQEVAKGEGSAGAMSGRGMRKLIHGVRRALSTRGPAMSTMHDQVMGAHSLGPRGATTNRPPGTAVVPQHQNRPSTIKMPVRIDLLGAEVAEDFKTAVREDAAAEAERRCLPNHVHPNGSPTLPNLDYSPAHMESAQASPGEEHDFVTNDEADVTSGSQSIVIVDDTLPAVVRPSASSATTVSPSVETFAEAFMPPDASHLTPPNTPPADLGPGIPRRSSYLLNQHVARHPMNDESPPSIPELPILEPSETRRTHESRTSRGQQGSRHRPLASNSFRVHRHKSSRTQRSLNSILHQQRASYSSGLVPPSTARSFDATTYSGESASKPDVEFPMPPPLRLLRRKPGGNLRGVNNVGELHRMALRKSRSVGSLTTYSESIRSSFLYSAHHDSFEHPGVATSDASQVRPGVFSLGQLAEKSTKRNLSVHGTYSSKPVMRPSFEMEAQKLAQIPDDEDDGGVESALLKLEGKFDPQFAKGSMDLPIQDQSDAQGRGYAVDPESIGLAIGTPGLERPSLSTNFQSQLTYGDWEKHEVMNEQSSASRMGGSQTDVSKRADTAVHSFLSEGSQESYCSIPLLERDLTDEGRSNRSTKLWTDRSVLQGPEDEPTPTEDDKGLHHLDSHGYKHRSFEFITTEADVKVTQPTQAVASETGGQSFLDLDDADCSELSSELSSEDAASEYQVGSSGGSPKAQLPEHPLAERSSDINHDKALSGDVAHQAAKNSPPTSRIPELYEEQIWDHKVMPPTPQATPSIPYFHPRGSANDPAGTSEILGQIPRPDPDEARKYSVHLPFILAFESEVLAQQFTLIEKDALNEIDWKELVDMPWKDCSRFHCRSWVQFLRNANAQGVEVVIARFNIMVKWAISEIVLTQNIEERAQCIIKYIHIAAHCRRYRNFATLAQLTIALTSNEVGRLARTWSLVPPKDLNTLQELETLVTPTRNFFNLRAEMEAGSGGGCIPFVMIYTHDLLYNGQRASEIASSPTTAPLVNFERCRIAASVVKTLLRLLEASTHYTFQPVEGITERCLWMGSLSDEEIRRRSQILE